MGVHGLWKLIEPSGQMVPLETLAGKILAVDVSIWLHQAVKGMHDAHGAPLAVAHLLILFHRICKLLFYKIKPVFVFDGGVPALKRQTMAARRQRSSAAKTEAMKLREKLIRNLLKHEAVRHMLSDETASVALGLNSFTLPGPSVEEDLYKLPPIAADYVDSESSDIVSSSDEESEQHVQDIHSIDITSQEFLSLPAEVRHDVLTELIETRKQSSWKYLESMPKQSDSFSDFQMNRLLKRHAVQTSLEKAGKEMGGRALSLKELESLLGDQGVLDPKADFPSKRIAQDSVTHYVLVHREDSKDTSNEGEKFDIMNHLEDVEYSSESDTDVILQKSHENEVKANETLTSTLVVEKVAENKENCSISKKAKVLITEEVADILSILEDEAATEDVKIKVENLQTKINSTEPSENLKTTDSNVSKDVNTADNLASAEEIATIPSELFHKGGKNVLKTTVPVSVPDLKVDINQEEVFQVKNSENAIDAKNTKEDILPVPVPKSAGKNAAGEVEDGADSSSESENDFVAIGAEESDIVLDDEKESEKPIESSNKDLTVVINPSDSCEKDDLFADVFESVPDEVAKRNSDEVEKTVELETGKGSDNTADFQFFERDFSELKKNLEEEQLELLKERGKQERLASNMNDQIYSDAQELLRFFGIPYVVAPMEAEAQCAALNAMGLTEGTITDDSDIWLFGGQVVYKNFFNQQKHVLEFRYENIQKCFKLTREEMIKMAMLVGSDYTVGLNGIGPVTALEIIATFQSPNRELLESLLKFRDWFTGAATNEPLRTSLRKKIKNTVITPGFPNRAVVETYLHPQVDDSKEPFSWAKPNLDLIHKYARAKIGWSKEKCNELLLPVIKKLEENTSQTTIDKHFKITKKASAAVGVLSKRVENAIKRLGTFSEDPEESEADDAKPRKRRKQNTSGQLASSSKNKREEKLKPVTEPKITNIRKFDGPSCASASVADQDSRIKLINEKLHQAIKVPQKEMSQNLLEQKKKEAIKIFRTFKKGGKKKTKVYAKEEVKLSESSSEDDH